MKHMRTGRSFSMALLVLAGCEAGPTSPVAARDVRLTIIGGDEQTAFAGSELPAPLVVLAEVEGKPWKNQVVNFVVTWGGGSVFAGAALTDNKGMAQEFWTLGGIGPQQLEVRAVLDGQKLVFASFTATAIQPPTPGKIECLSGDGSWQVNGSCGWDNVLVGSSAPVTFRVVTSDRLNVVPGVVVTFDIDPTCLGYCDNPGSVNPSFATTDSNGMVTVDWTLGPNTGSNRLQASVPGVGSVGVWRSGS